MNRQDGKKQNMPVHRIKSGLSLRKAYIIAGISVMGMLFAACGSEFGVLFDSDTPFRYSSEYRVFWTESSGSISTASTDGNHEAEILTVSGTPMDIDLYMPDRKIYWTEEYGVLYMIKSAGLDGTGESIFITYDSSDYHGPTAIAIDTDAGNPRIYWNRYQYVSGLNDIWRSVLSSTSPEKWVNDLIYNYTYAIALDTASSNILVTANTSWDINGTLGSSVVGAMITGNMDTSGTGSERFSSSGDGSINPYVPLRDVAVDSSGGHVYYVDDSSADSIIKRTDLSFGNSTNLVTASGFDMDRIALDLAEGKIYWTSRSDRSIYRADLDGSGVERFKQLSSTPMGIAVAP